MRVLSGAQRRIAQVLVRLDREQRPALVPELVRALGLAGESSLTPTLRVMVRNGYLDILGGGAQGRPRMVRLTAKGRRVMGAGGLPLLGAIPAGPLKEALAQPAEMVELHQLIAARPNDFLLRVSGDSMIDDGVFDGDLVLLRPDVPVGHGEIAAVCVGETREGTLKRVFVEGERVRLQAGNSKYADIVVPAAEVRIAGVFRGLIRDAGRRH